MKFKAQTHDLELWPWPWVGMVKLLILRSNLWPRTVTLTLCRHGWVMSSAHRLTEANIWSKFKENPSMGIGNMERTRNSRLKTMILTCDLDLELAWLTYGFCTLTYWGEHLTKVYWNSFKEFRRYGADKKVLQKDRRMDRRTDEGHFYNPPSASRRGIKTGFTGVYINFLISAQKT